MQSSFPEAAIRSDRGRGGGAKAREPLTSATTKPNISGLPDRFTAHIRQALVTALAAIASYWVAYWFRLPEAYWAVISSIIVMQSSIGATVGASWNRLAGTALGAFMGALFATFWGTNVWAFGVAVAVTVWLCASLGLLESYRLAGVTVAVVMLAGRTEFFWTKAVRRFLEVAVGIIVSVVITGMTWSSRARKDLLGGISRALVAMQALYSAIVSRYRGEEGAPIQERRAEVRAILQNNDKLLKEAAYEPAMGTSPTVLALWGDHLKRILLAINALELATRDGQSGMMHYSGFEPELGNLLSAISQGLYELSRAAAEGHDIQNRKRLEAAVTALDAKVSEVRGRGITLGFNLEDTLRFYAFVSALRNLARELDMVEVGISEETRDLP